MASTTRFPLSAEQESDAQALAQRIRELTEEEVVQMARLLVIKPDREIFADIAWSTDCVLQQTIERARQMNLKIHLLPTCYDVDDRMTLRRLCDELFGPNGSTGGGYPAPATREYLGRLLQREGRGRIWPHESES